MKLQNQTALVRYLHQKYYRGHMTSEQQRRMQELPSLIAGEPNTEKMATLTAELEKLLALNVNEMKSSQKRAGSEQLSQ